jgi:hypothetical protein
MTLFLITFIVLCLVMGAMGLNVLIGRSRELSRGCGKDCECLSSGRPQKECRP